MMMCMIQSVNIADFHNLICVKSLVQLDSESCVFLALSADRLHWTWVAASAVSVGHHSLENMQPMFISSQLFIIMQYFQSEKAEYHFPMLDS